MRVSPLFLPSHVDLRRHLPREALIRPKAEHTDVRERGSKLSGAGPSAQGKTDGRRLKAERVHACASEAWRHRFEPPRRGPATKKPPAVGRLSVSMVGREGFGASACGGSAGPARASRARPNPLRKLRFRLPRIPLSGSNPREGARRRKSLPRSEGFRFRWWAVRGSNPRPWD